MPQTDGRREVRSLSDRKGVVIMDKLTEDLLKAVSEYTEGGYTGAFNIREKRRPRRQTVHR